ncbi:hypothetical protein ACHAO7_010754 [Fusarium culmorum]
MTSTSDQGTPSGPTDPRSTTQLTEISTQTFHAFPNLPPELRMKIWKASCLPRSEHDHGIQHVTADVVQENWDGDYDEIVVCDEHLEYFEDDFDVETDEMGYVTLRASKRDTKLPVNFQTTTDQSKKSAYLWDHGLWMACRESRAAITEYLKIDSWLRHYTADQEHLLFSLPCAPSQRHILHYPSTVRYLPRSLYNMHLLAPFLGRRNFTIIQQWNIALKFDRSWLIGFPDNIYQLRQENSPRGLLANWMDRFQDAVGPEPTLWIVDDTVSWVTLPGLECKTLYRDCGAEYVQSYWFAVRDNTAPKTPDVEEFMILFSRLLEEDGGYDDLEIANMIQLLVRKDRELPPESDAETEDGEVEDGDKPEN